MKTVNPGRFVIANSDLKIKGNSHIEVDSNKTGFPGMIPKETLGKITEVRGDKVKISISRKNNYGRELAIWVERYMIGQLFRNR